LKIFKPVGNVLAAYGKAVSAADDFGGFFDRMEPVVKSEAVEDHPERKAPAFVDKRSKSSLASSAEVQLDCFIFLFSFSFLDYVGAAAVGTIYNRFGLGDGCLLMVRMFHAVGG
jgi:hypothetical protein